MTVLPPPVDNFIEPGLPQRCIENNFKKGRGV